MSETIEQVKALMGKVFALVRACPEGRVTTYGWLAQAIGSPRGARMIGFIMHETPEGVPAHRVVNSKGELSGSWAFGTPETMRERLEAEQIPFLAENRVDIQLIGWNPLIHLSRSELSQILQTAPPVEHTPSPRLVGRVASDPAIQHQESPQAPEDATPVQLSWDALS